VTVHFGPENIVAQVEIYFAPKISADSAAHAIDRIERGLKRDHPALKQISIEAEARPPSARA
jgi:hypothetical protein